MKIILISIASFLLFFAHIVNAQQITFEYSLVSPNDELVYDINETVENEILFCGSVAQTTNRYYRSMLIVKLDNFGNLVDSTIYSISGRSTFARRLLVKDTNSFVIISMISDTLITRNETALGLYNLDLDINVSNETIYNFDSIYLLEEISAGILSNNNILASISLRIHPHVPKSYFYEFNSNFDSIRSKYYPDGSRTISHLHELSHNNIWTLNMLLNKYELLDSALNIVSAQNVPDMLTSNFGVKWDTDTSFYLVGDGMGFSPLPSHNLGFIRQCPGDETA